MRSSLAALTVAVLLAHGPAYAQKPAPDCSPFASLDSKASSPLSPATAAKNCKVTMSNGFPVPDPKCTPGAINPTLTVDVLRNPKFRTGCVRNDATTEKQKASTYDAYGIRHPANNSGSTQSCELDHLVSLELGGADTLDNIWPQCGPPGAALAKRYFKEKDTVENFLAAQVKKGSMSLGAAQQGIASDWTQFLGDAKKACPGGRCK